MILGKKKNNNACYYNCDKLLFHEKIWQTFSIDIFLFFIIFRNPSKLCAKIMLPK